MINLHLHFHVGSLSLGDFPAALILSKLESIMITQDQLVQRLDAASLKLEKIGTEVATLKDLLAQAGSLSPEAEASLARLEGLMTQVDDLNPDAGGAAATGG